jgi:hypothetical protein
MDTEGLLSVALRFDEPLTSTTRAEIAGSTGLADRREFPLPDGTVLTEFRLPFDLSASTTEWTGENGMRASIQGQDVYLGDVSAFGIQTELPKNCSGSLIAVLDGKSINDLFEKLLRFSIFEVPNQLIWLESDGNAVLCW